MPVQWGTNPAVSQSVFLLRDVIAARPAAAPANQDYYFLATDDNGGTLYQSTGSDWVQVAGAVDDPDVNTYAGLTDVITNYQEDRQIFGWLATAQKYGPLFGLTGDSHLGLFVVGGIQQGVSPADHLYDSEFNGLVQVVSDGTVTQSGQTVFSAIQQDVAPGGIDLKEMALFERGVARAAGRSIGPIVRIHTYDGGDGSVPVLPGELMFGTEGPAGIGVQMNAAGGLAMFGHAVPTVQPTGGAATAGAAYGATEQGMLQKVYDAARVLGLLS